jgi:1-deoxy-D-xylulose-5-phosphate reductoisomerase
VILTASGGPFRGASSADLAHVTVEQALNHPTWRMGPRITVDAATLMTKAFEVIEAHFLFGVSYDQIDVVVHPQSFVHSFVEFTDGVVKAEVGFPDMRKPIQYAITYPDRAPANHRAFNIAGESLTFFEPDLDVFTCLALGYQAGRAGGTGPAVLNAADEVAVAAFLDGEVGFLDIGRVVEDVLDRHDVTVLHDVDDVSAADGEGRAYAREACERIRSM